MCVLWQQPLLEPTMARSRPPSPARKRPRFRLRSCARDAPHSSRTADGLDDAASVFINQLRDQRSEHRRIQNDLKDTLRSLASERNRVAELSQENGRLRCQRDAYCRKLEAAERDADDLEHKVKDVSADAHAERSRMESELKAAKDKFNKENASLREQIDTVKKERDDALESFKQILGKKLKKEMVNHIRTLDDIIGNFTDSESDAEAVPPKDEAAKQTPEPVLPVVASPDNEDDSYSSYSDSDAQGS